jgi:hypothetical protein
VTYELSDKEKEGVLGADDDKAYGYFLGKAADQGQVWSLVKDGKFASLRDDEGRKCFPVWPHPGFAQDVATGGWEGYEPKAIEVHDFLDHCRRFEEDGRHVAILHRPSGDYLSMPPIPLAEHLQAELDRVE